MLPGADKVSLLGGFEHIPEPPPLLERLESLGEQELAEVIAVVEARSKQERVGYRSPASLLDRAHYRVKPVDPYTFFTAKEYCGELASKMYPLLLDRLCRILVNPYVNEVILTGAIGWGKSYVMGFGQAYELYRVLCLRDPMRIFGKAPGTRILFVSLSVTGENASDIMFEYVRNIVAEAPVFQRPEFAPMRMRRGAAQIRWEHNNIIYRSANSQETSVIGDNVMSAAFDEANFFISAHRSARSRRAGELDQAQVMYDALSSRKESRFLLPDSSTLGRLWMSSSKQFPGDFLERRINKSKDSPYVAVMDYPQWLPQMTTSDHPYGKRRRFVFLGNASHPCRVLGSIDNGEMTVEQLADVVANLPQGCRVQAVPDVPTIRKAYNDSLYTAVRDKSGWSVIAVNPFLDPPSIYRSCVCDASLGDVARVHPFSVDEPLGCSLDYITPQAFPIVLMSPRGEPFDPRNGEHQRTASTFFRRPKVNPHRARFVHVDLGRTKDGAAFAIGHFGGFKRVVTDSLVNGKLVVHVEERPITIIDVMARFYAPPMSKLEPHQVRQVIMACFEFGAYAGFELVTYDMYQSFDSVDAFEAMGIESHNKMSLDRDDRPYMTFRQSLCDHRTSYYAYEPLFQDCSSLEHNIEKGKVDHTANRSDGTSGTKDVSDCVAAIHWHIADRHRGARYLPILPGELEQAERAQTMSARTLLTTNGLFEGGNLQ